MADAMTPKRRGRPALDEGRESVAVNVRMSAKVYDDTYTRAQRDRVSIPERVRRDMREAEKDRRS